MQGAPAITAQAKTTDKPTRGRSVGRRLTLLVVCVAVSMALLATAIVLWLTQSDGAARREAIAYSAKTIRAAVDGQLEKLIVIGRIFSASPSLERSEFAEFRREAEQALQGVKGIWVVVADPAGQQIVNLATPPGAPLPKRAPEGIATQRRAFESKKPEISNIFTGVYTKKPIVTVELPIFRDNAPLYVVAVAVDDTQFLGLLSREQMPEGWLAGILDRRGDFIARTLDHERMVGKPAAAGWRTIMNRDGLFEFTVLEGDTIVEANVVSALSGWAIGVAANKAVFDASLWQGLGAAALGGGAIALVGALLAMTMARSMTRPAGGLERSAHASEASDRA